MDEKKKHYIFKEGVSWEKFVLPVLDMYDDAVFLSSRFVKNGNITLVGKVENKITKTVFYGIPKYVDENEFLKSNDFYRKPIYVNEKEFPESGGFSETGREHFELLEKVIKKADEANYLFDPDIVQQRQQELELRKIFIEDYLRHGLYVHRVNETGRFGRGRIKWGKTVSRVQPIISGENVIYTDYYRQNSFIDNGDIVSQIHAAIMKKVLEVSENTGIDVPDSALPEVDGMDGETRETLRNLLKKRLRESYTNRDIELIKAMIAYLGESIWYSRNDPQKCTNSFELVWEEVCRGVWGSDSVKPESDNPKYHFYNEKDKEEVYNEKDKTEVTGSGTQKPDIIRVSKDEKRVTVFDAKYYLYWTEKLPSSSDISKQVAYLNMIKRDVRDRLNENEYGQYKFLNIFLFPEKYPNSGGGFRHAGYVKYPGFSFLDKYFGENKPGEKNNTDDFDDRVDIVIADPEWLYKAYLGKGGSDLNENIEKLLREILDRKEKGK